jgi:hypothetical protein
VLLSGSSSTGHREATVELQRAKTVILKLDELARRAS